MAYTAQEVAEYLAANPQLTADEILSLAKAYDVGADVLYEAISVESSPYQGVTYDQVAEAYQAAPVQEDHLAQAQAQAEAEAQYQAQLESEYQAPTLAQEQAGIQQEAQAQAALGGVIPESPLSVMAQPEPTQPIVEQPYTAQEVAEFIATNPQLGPDEILSLARANNVGADVLFDAVNVDGGRFQGASYSDVAEAYQAAPAYQALAAPAQAYEPEQPVTSIMPQEAQAQAALGGIITEPPASIPQVVQSQQSEPDGPMAYTAQEVAAFIADNPQLSPEEILGLAKSNAVSSDVLFDALNVEGGRFQGVNYNDVAAAYQATPVEQYVEPRPVAGTPMASAPNEPAYTPGQITDQQLKDFFVANPNVSNEQTYALMQQYQVSPAQIVSALGLDPSTAYGQYNQQVVNEARPGEVTDYQLKAYFANNPNVPDSQIYALMNQYKVTPEQISRAIGVPLAEAEDRYRSARYENIPTGLGGAEDARRQALADASGTMRGAETASRFDIENALEKINKLYGVNIDDLRTAATQAAGYFQPFQQGGTTAFNQQMALSGALGQDAFTAARQESPYERFLFEQGMRANLAGAAATGGLGGGNVQKELQRFGQDLSSKGLQQQINNLELLSGKGIQAAGAMGDITLNTAQNIAGQRGDMASYQGQAGVALSNIGQSTGRTIAEMQYGTGQDIAAARSRVAEQQALQIQNAALEQSRLLSGLGEFQANLIGDQSANLINMQNAAANRAALNATGLAQGVSGLQTGLVGDQMDAYSGANRINAPSFDYGQAFNAAAGGYNLGQQVVNQPRQGGAAPVSTSIPSSSRYGPYFPNYQAPPPVASTRNPFNVNLGNLV